MRNPGRFLLELLYPTRCILCREELSPGRPRLCPRCLEEIRTPANARFPYVSVCVSALRYEGDAAEAIRRYKFRSCRAYADAFGSLVSERIYTELSGKYDLITWVPISSDRRRERGFDQSRLLAESAAKHLRQTAVPTLKKKRRVPRQSLLRDPQARKANVLGVYSVTKPEAVAGKRILLIDDIATTGATISECAKTLLMAGAEEVLAAALAKTPKAPAGTAE